jgi:hypothetical protein
MDAYFVRLLLLFDGQLLVNSIASSNNLPRRTLRTSHAHVEMISLPVPVCTIICCSSHCLVTNLASCRLGIVIRNDLVRLWWIALVLCVVLTDLSLCILWTSRLIVCCGIGVVTLSGRGILDP